MISKLHDTGVKRRTGKGYAPRTAAARLGLRALIVAVFGFSVPSQGRAAPILNIDATDTANVVVTATGAAPLVTLSRQGSTIRLLDVFSAPGSNFGIGTDGSDTFRPTVSGAFNIIGRLGANLNFGGGAFNTNSFDITQPAFTGQSIVNQSFLPWPTSNLTGDVAFFDDNGANPVVIGGYTLTVTAVPLPPSVVLLSGAIGLGLVVGRRRRTEALAARGPDTGRI